MRRKVVLMALAVGVLGGVLSAPASATFVNPGDTGKAPDTILASEVTGTPLLADTGVKNFTLTNGLGQSLASGNFREIVVVDHITGFLDFVYEFEVTSTTTDVVDRMSTGSYAGFTTDVGVCPSCPDVVALNAPQDGNATPSTVDRSGDGTTIGFNFSGGVSGPTGDTYDLIIATDAPNFTNGSTQLIDNGTANLVGYAPAPAPEPGTLTLFGSGLIALAGLVRRKCAQARA
jgi:hypothetical protein